MWIQNATLHPHVCKTFRTSRKIFFKSQCSKFGEVFEIRRMTLLLSLIFQDFPITAKILSAQFWPHVKEERIGLPEEAQKALEKFKKAFETRKAQTRTIEWWPNAGSVEVQLEMDDRSIKMLVSPVQAAIIYHFMERGAVPSKFRDTL